MMIDVGVEGRIKMEGTTCKMHKIRVIIRLLPIRLLPILLLLITNPTMEVGGTKTVGVQVTLGEVLEELRGESLPMEGGGGGGVILEVGVMGMA